MAAKLGGKNVLMVIAPENFRDEELLEPKKILGDAGAKVVVASTRGGAAKGMLGATVTPDLLISDARAKDYDAIVVVGGMGSPAHLWKDAALKQLLADGKRSGKVVAGICLSGAALANAGVLRGVRATVWATPDSVKALKDGGATYVKDHVVADGRVITADGPDAARDFGNQIAAALG